MKKLGLLYICLCTLMFTGCGRENLTCIQTTKSEEGMELTDTIVMTFENHKVIQMNITSVISLSDQYRKYVEEFETTIKQKYQELENKKGITYKTSKTENEISLMIHADLKKMNQDAKDSLSIVNPHQSKIETKEELESSGYKCK